MVDLKITDNGIYYIEKYVPYYKWNWDKYKDNHQNSKMILDYKDGEKLSTIIITTMLEDAIISLSNDILFKYVNEIALVAVPPSKVNKYSPIRESINRIINKYDSGEITEFKFLNKIHNCSKLLLREEDIESSKMDKSKRIKFNHYRTIDFDEDLIDDLNDDVVYIIIDDITTTGFTMEVCEEILIDNGVNEDNIYKLVIAETVDDYYG